MQKFEKKHRLWADWKYVTSKLPLNFHRDVIGEKTLFKGQVCVDWSRGSETCIHSIVSFTECPFWHSSWEVGNLKILCYFVLYCFVFLAEWHNNKVSWSWKWFMQLSPSSFLKKFLLLKVLHMSPFPPHPIHFFTNKMERNPESIATTGKPCNPSSYFQSSLISQGPTQSSAYKYDKGHKNSF